MTRVPGDDTDAGTRTPGDAPSRWWLNPALAQLAFGSSVDMAGATASVSITSSMASALHGLDAMVLDLDDPAQRTFGDYELLEQIGQGGMGMVFRARQRQLQREVAIKLLSAGAWAPEPLVDALRREAQHAAQLQHPNIVTVHEMGEHEGLIFYAMQLVRGRSLSQQLDADGPMPPRDAARLLRTVAEAVDYAHRLGVLHLDLKPGNILIDETPGKSAGTPLVTDFGLARRIEQALEHDRIAGTPSYMAPEQARADGTALMPAADVWALGAVLYETLTGHPPFDGSDTADTVRLLLECEVRKPSRYLPVPADLEAICMKCLAKSPARRYPDARALADDLGRFLEGRAVGVRPLNAAQRMWRWARREPHLAAAAGLALLSLVGGVVATSLQWQRADTNAAAASERLWESRREAALRLQQDGKGYEAMPRLLQNIEEQERGGHAQLAALDRRRLGMLAGEGAVLIDTLAIADANPLATALSDDGSLLAIAFNDQSVRWFETATLRERGRVDLKGRVSANGEPRTPILLRFVDNRQLRVTLEWVSNLASPTDGDTWLVDLDRASVIEPPAAFADFADAAYSADGRHALLRNHDKQAQLWQVAPWAPQTPRVFKPDGLRRDYTAWQVGPGGGHALMLGPGNRVMSWFDTRDPDRIEHLRFPGDAGISAWNHSRDGRWLALGDLEGRVFLLDTRTRALRTLPTTRGREITWVAFSEDDAWLAAASWDGMAYAFDVARGDSLVTGQMRHDMVLRRVELSRARRMLVASSEGQAAVWRLPEAGPRSVPAQRIGAGPAAHGLAGPYAISWSWQSGLLASAGMDGQVRLWRLPMSPMQPARAARQIAETLQFDGRRLVDVEWNRLRLVPVDGSAPSRWINLAQPPGFAELIDAGRTLVLTIGPQLHVYDARTLQPRFAPLALPNSPQRLLASPDGARLFLTFAGSGGITGLQEQLHAFDLRSGRRLPGEAMLAGPLRTLALSPDSRRLLSIGPSEDATTVLAMDGLRRLADYPHDPFQPVIGGAFHRDGQQLWLLSAAEDPRLGRDALLRWNPETDAVLEQSTGRAQPKGVLATAHGVFVVGHQHDLLTREDQPPRKLGRVAESEADARVAISADGQLVARVFRREVQLHDAVTGALVGPPLHSESNAIDGIEAVAFSPDSRRLLARTMHGRWLLWRIGEDGRTVDAIATQLARLDPGNEHQQRVHLPSSDERRRLRALDPGAWAPIAARPAIPTQAPARIDGSTVPARLAGTSPLLLDLGELYTSGPDGVRSTWYTVRPQLRPYPAGVQRFGGTDYDVRGMVEIGTLEWMERATTSAAAGDCIPVPVDAAALRLLVLPVVPIATDEPQTLARLTWHYRDGGRASSPLRTQHELPGYHGHDQDVPLVFASVTNPTAIIKQSEALSAPRLQNPQPGRALRCVALDTSGQPMLLFAITAEPPPRPSVGKPVIAPPVSRTRQ